MWLILFNSMLAIVVFLERLFQYHRAQIHAIDFVNGIRNSIRSGNIAEATATSEETPGPVAEVVKTALIHHELPREEIQETVHDVARVEVSRLEKYLPVLATIAQVTPLIGFLGTVTGMIKIFMVIEKSQSANPGQLAGGVWEALLTTAAGLMVAIPTYVGYNYLVGGVKNFVLDMEKATNEITNCLTRKTDKVAPSEPVPYAEKEKP